MTEFIDRGRLDEGCRIITGCVSSFSSSCWVEAKDADELTKIYHYAVYSDPLIFQCSGYRYRKLPEGYEVMPNYVLSRHVYEAMRNGCLAKARGILDRIPSSSDYRMLQGLHREVCSSVTYSFIQGAHESYGPLLRGAGVCEGISKMVKVVCDLANVPCLLAIGDAGGPHMWNLVEVDGRWYNADFTFDLRPETSEREREDYFLISDKSILRSRQNYGWIVCDSDLLDPFRLKGSMFHSVEDAREYADRRVRRGFCSVDFRLVGDDPGMAGVQDMMLSVLNDAGWVGSCRFVGAGRGTYHAELRPKA